MNLSIKDIKMKPIFRHISILILLLGIALPAKSQMIKMNGPAILCGSPNIGYEHGLSRHFSISGDVIWLPYMKKKHEEVFRSFQAAAEGRYYFKPSEHDADYIATGWYAGAYAMWGDFNIGLYRHHDMDRSVRRRGWGVSAGISGGWKYEFNKHWQMDINLGIGYAHLQYNKYKLGGLYENHPYIRKKTRGYFGPTRFSVSFGYIIPTGLKKK